MSSASHTCSFPHWLGFWLYIAPTISWVTVPIRPDLEALRRHAQLQAKRTQGANGISISMFWRVYKWAFNVSNEGSPPFSFVHYFPKVQKNGWGDGVKVLERLEMFHLERRESAKGHKRKVMSVFNTAAYPRGRQRKCDWLEGESGAVSDSLIWFYYLFETWTRCWLAGWLALLGGGAKPDGANGIPMPEPHLSVVMAGWQVLMDRWSWRLSWQSCLVDVLWNETDIQKLWAAQAWTDPTPPHLFLPSPGQLVWQWVPQCSYPSFTMTEVMWAAKLGTTETHCPALGLDLKSFNDRLRPSITLTFLFNAVLVEYKIK